ncbi:YrbL family protein [uncultured Bartonella sp.]|uniref:YrbL family protein n=1 Tax=uncultured Bartonella sp. TaxID=104108 RepID=UPI0025FADE8E|nr:YrbL family protein [uncultured Bartonella sp.]
MDHILTLSDKAPLYEGLTRAVFINDRNPDYLVKIPSLAWRKKIAGFSPWRRFRKAVDVNSPNTRELSEYMRHFADPDMAKNEKHLMQIGGLIATDIGWGLLVKAERDQEGNYAKTFGTYQNDIPRFRPEIDEFIAWVKSTSVICYDLKFDNILLSWRNGKPTLVLIDGIGETGLFTLRKWFSKYNHAKNIHELQEFIDALKPFPN